MVGARVAVPAEGLAWCGVDVCVLCVVCGGGGVEEEVKRWSGGGKELAVVPGRMGWHLGRVLKVGISGPAQRRQKCLPIDAALGKGKGKLTRSGQSG